MDISIFLAKAFGLYLVIVSLPFLFNYKKLHGVLEEMTHNRGILLITAFMALILGVPLVLVHNIWVADWRVVITVLCWLTLIKGITRFYFPSKVQRWTRKFLHHHSNFIICGCVCLVLGVYLLYMSF